MSDDIFWAAIRNNDAYAIVSEMFSKHAAVSSAIGPQQPMSRCPDLVEGPPPCADTGTAGVSDLYPVRCAARYYDAASQILESEPQLHSHHNANELGALIEAWIHRARNNWEPK